MLIEFSVANYLSFKDKVTLNMVASNDKTLPDNLIPSAQGTKYSLLKSVAIYGPNASGKSNLIRAFDFMRWFVINSSREGQKGDPIKVKPFKLDATCLTRPSEFEVSFLKDGIQYLYGFSADKEKVWEEWFYHYPKKQPALLFKREGKVFKFGTYWKGEKAGLAEQTRDNALFVSVASQFGNEMATIVLDWFSSYSIFVSSTKVFPLQKYFTEKSFLEDSKARDFVNKLIKKADLGISDLKIEKSYIEKELESKEGTMSMEELVNHIHRHTSLDFSEGLQYVYETTVFHKGIDNDGHEIQVPLNLSTEESDGTKKIFALAGRWFYALGKGCCLVSDELDVHLHPLLTKWLIEIFQNAKTSEKGAQLIFATHDSSLLEHDLFRRDQVCLIEKDPSGASDLYSLADLKNLRNGENFRKGYLVGRYGAIPFVGDLQE